MTEQYELRPTIDHITQILAERGGKADIKTASRRYPTFTEYVVRPGRFYFSLGFIAVFALGIGLMIWFDLYASFKWWLVASFLATTTGVIVYATIAAMLTDEWRQLVNGQSNDIHIEAGINTSPVERPMAKVGPGTKRISRHKFWKRNGMALLRQRMISGDEWVGGDRLTRKMLAGCITNFTDNFRPACDELVEWGWLVKENDAYFWLDKGRQELSDYGKNMALVRT